ncbi:MAG: hypothetical protein RLZZ546_450 [Bacteroidota bacterium]|jgi:phosphoribosylanthranilate isomerase
MKVKVCGIKASNDIQDLIDLGVEYVGLNFYSKSPRFFQEDNLNIERKKCKIVGLFVNEGMDYIKEKMKLFALDIVQLHGNEDVSLCRSLSSIIEVWKAVPHHQIADNSYIKSYEVCHKLLFDTASERFGGSGEKFDWKNLKQYKGKRPYLIAGGIDLSDVEEILKIEKEPYLEGVDINSKFEISPGIKDIKKIEQFIKILNK